MTQFEDPDNPYRAPEMLFELAQEVVPKGQYFWVRLLLILQLMTALIGNVAAFVDVETIVASGPILSILGILVTIASLRRRFHLGLWIGMSGPAISLIIFLVIFLQHWNPSEAQKPIPILAALYVAVVCLLGLAALQRIAELQRRSGSGTNESGEILPIA